MLKIVNFEKKMNNHEKQLKILQLQAKLCLCQNKLDKINQLVKKYDVWTNGYQTITKIQKLSEKK